MSANPSWELLQRHPLRPVVVGHRGASGEAPENTLASLRRALALGTRATETDVYLTLDGHVVAMHDRTVSRTTDGKGAIASLTLAQVQQLDAGSWFGPEFAGEPVPTLGELLDATRDRAVLCIEIKAGADIVPAIAAQLDHRAMRDQVVIFSFDPDAVGLAGVHLPEVPSLLLATRSGVPRTYDPAVIDQALLLNADALGFNHRSLTPELVDAAHGAGLPVFVYTVNERRDLDRVRALGVDGVISDWPSRVQGWLGG
jgi:glycerophosphoryl diester phosphodiesterase